MKVVYIMARCMVTSVWALAIENTCQGNCVRSPDLGTYKKNSKSFKISLSYLIPSLLKVSTHFLTMISQWYEIIRRPTADFDMLLDAK